MKYVFLCALRRQFIAALVGFAVFFGAATGAESEYKLHYDAYLTAIERNDTAAAERHAEQAWRAAEDEAGDSYVTGVLAFNYGRYVLFNKTELARPALKRAQQLVDTGVVTLPDDLGLYLTYCDFKIEGERDEDAERLYSMLKLREAGGSDADFESATIWLHLALHQLNKKHYEDAVYSAAIAEKAIVDALPESYQSQAQAIIIRGAAMLLPRPRSVETFVQVHAEFVRAQELFPYQKDIASFDPVLAMAIAWEKATHGALRSDEPSDTVKNVEAIWKETEIRLEGFIDEEDCAGDWLYSRLHYPTKASDWGTIGAVVMGFDFREDGHVDEPRILAEVPGTLFGKHVLGRMRSWRHEKPLDPRPGCRRNRIHTVHFSIR